MSSVITFDIQNTEDIFNHPHSKAFGPLRTTAIAVSAAIREDNREALAETVGDAVGQSRPGLLILSRPVSAPGASWQLAKEPANKPDIMPDYIELSFRSSI